MRFTLSLSLFGLAALFGGCFSPDYASPGFYCHPEDNPACPDGYKCNGGRCVQVSGMGIMTGDGGTSLIPKMGPPYTGVHMDRMDLNMANMCPDADLEPNDSPSQARLVMTMPDMPTAKLIKLAICPKGPNPATGMHDVDYFKVDTSGVTQSTLTLMAQVYYDITYGDLDIGVFDDTGRLLSSDGTAVTNGCVAASIGKGSYYVVIVGANNMDVNSYDLSIRTFSMPKTCPSLAPMPDLSSGGMCQMKSAPCAVDGDCCSNFCSPTAGVCA
jgi:hypothetical protein